MTKCTKLVESVCVRVWREMGQARTRAQDPYIYIIAGPHVIGNDELRREFRHKTGRSIFANYKNSLFGVRRQAGEVLHFLFCPAAGHCVIYKRSQSGGGMVFRFKLRTYTHLLATKTYSTQSGILLRRIALSVQSFIENESFLSAVSFCLIMWVGNYLSFLTARHFTTKAQPADRHILPSKTEERS